MTKRRWLPKNVSRFPDRHGKWRYRYRKVGQPTYYFQNEPGTEGFREELRACEAGRDMEIGANRIRPGTINDLVARYFKSQSFNNGSAMTQLKNRGILESFRSEHGDKLVSDVQFEHLDAILARKAAKTPFAAINLRKQLRRLFAYAVKARMRADNPVEQTETISAKTEGHHTWTEAEIQAYERRHPIGTMPRLALDLMLWTSARRGDAVRLGKANLHHGEITYSQQKTGKEITLPVAAELAESILATAKPEAVTFLVTAYGKPFSDKAFGMRMRKWCNEAGLPHCSAHGLRKAMARRLAHLGLGNQAIKAITGHSTDAEVALYTRKVEQASLARLAMGQLEDYRLATSLANRPNGDQKTAENCEKPLDLVGPEGLPLASDSNEEERLTSPDTPTENCGVPDRLANRSEASDGAEQA